MHSVVTAIIVQDLLYNVAHSPDLSMDVEPTPYAQTQDDELHCVSYSFKPLYPRHLLVPHGSGTINIAKRYRAAIRCTVVVKQRIMPRAANRYYASSWVIGAHPTDMLTGRGANLCGTHPFCIRGTITAGSTICPRSRAASRDSCAEMYEIRIERRLVTAYGQAPIVQALVS